MNDERLYPTFENWIERYKKKQLDLSEKPDEEEPKKWEIPGMKAVEQLSPLRINVNVTKTGALSPVESTYDPKKLQAIIESRDEISRRLEKPVALPFWDIKTKTRLYVYGGETWYEDRVRRWEKSSGAKPITEESDKAEVQSSIERKQALDVERVEKAPPSRFAPIRFLTPEEYLVESKIRREVPTGLPKGKWLLTPEQKDKLPPDWKKIEEYVPGAAGALTKAQIIYEKNPSDTNLKALKNIENSIIQNVILKSNKEDQPSLTKALAKEVAWKAWNIGTEIISFPVRLAYATVNQLKNPETSYIVSEKKFYQDFASKDAPYFVMDQTQDFRKALYALDRIGFGTAPSISGNWPIIKELLTPGSERKKRFNTAYNSKDAASFAEKRGLYAGLCDLAVSFLWIPSWMKGVQTVVRGGLSTVAQGVKDARIATGLTREAEAIVKADFTKEFTDAFRKIEQTLPNHPESFGITQEMVAPRLGAKWVGIQGKGPVRLAEYRSIRVPRVKQPNEELANILITDLDKKIDDALTLARVEKKSVIERIKGVFRTEVRPSTRPLLTDETKRVLNLKEEGKKILNAAERQAAKDIKNIIQGRLSAGEEARIIAAQRNPKFWILDPKTKYATGANIEALRTAGYTEREIGVIRRLFVYTEDELKAVAEIRLARGEKFTPHIKEKGYWPSELEVREGLPIEVKPYKSEPWLQKQKGGPAQDLEEGLDYIATRRTRFKVRNDIIEETIKAQTGLTERLKIAQTKNLTYEASNIEEGLKYVNEILTPVERRLPGKLGFWETIGKKLGWTNTQFMKWWRQAVLNWNPRWFITQFLDTSSKNLLAGVPFEETWKPLGWIDDLGKHRTFGKLGW